MTTYFVTRHPGAAEWARQKGIEAEAVSHLDATKVNAGDAVLGTLPVNMVAEINRRGARYMHLSLDLPPDLRGRELTADEMGYFGAKLEEYEVRRVE